LGRAGISKNVIAKIAGVSFFKTPALLFSHDIQEVSWARNKFKKKSDQV
jgi:hypothetical protein